MNGSAVALSWTASTDAVGVSRYTISRGAIALAIVDAGVTSFLDRTAAPSTAYAYTVSAADAATNTSAPSAAANIATPAAQPPPDTTAPSVPTGVTAAAVSATQVDVSWTASTDDVGVAGYRLYRDGLAVGTLPVGSTSFSDTGRNGSTAYAYTVAALDAAGNASAASTPAASATTPAPPFTTIAYGYDLADRLTGIAPSGSPAVTFTPDALGRHASRSLGGTLADTYAYLGTSATVVRDVTPAGTLDSALDATGARLAITTSTGAFGWLMADLHGNVAGAVSAAGSAVSDAFRYDAYGRTSASATSALPTPWRYQGRLLENATGSPDLLDFGARAYAPDLGAFTSLDTLTGSVLDPASLNRYLYAEANPATLVDPDGHRAEYGLGGAGAGVRHPGRRPPRSPRAGPARGAPKPRRGLRRAGCRETPPRGPRPPGRHARALSRTSASARRPPGRSRHR
jgi:RHS repeat-associated protein